MTALFTRLTAAAGFKTTGRRLIMWSEVPLQPALFLVDGDEEYMARPTGLPAKPIIEAEVWIYSKAGADPHVEPGPALNGLLDAIEDALAPTPVFNGVSVQNSQTLGGIVEHCWIEGRVLKYPGHLDGQAVAIVPIKILVPQ